MSIKPNKRPANVLQAEEWFQKLSILLNNNIPALEMNYRNLRAQIDILSGAPIEQVIKQYDLSAAQVELFVKQDEMLSAEVGEDPTDHRAEVIEILSRQIQELNTNHIETVKIIKDINSNLTEALSIIGALNNSITKNKNGIAQLRKALRAAVKRVEILEQKVL